MTGIVPYTMVQAGGEGEKVVRDDETDGTMTRQTPWTYMNETGREKVSLQCSIRVKVASCNWMLMIGLSAGLNWSRWKL